MKLNAIRHDNQLRVAAGGANVRQGDVDVLAPAQHSGASQRVLTLAHLEKRRSARTQGNSRGGGRGDLTCHHGPADPERSGAQVFDLGKDHLDRTDERPALLDGRFGEHGGQLLAEGFVVLPQPLAVGGRQLDDVAVGDQDAPRTQDRLLVLSFARESGGDLDGFDPATEGARECALNQAFEPSFESLESAHARLLPSSA